MRNRSTSLFAFTFTHFCIDFGCAFLLYRFFSVAMAAPDVALGFFIYSILAFGLQAPIGALCDRLHGFPAGMLGIALVLAALFLGRFAYPALVLCAVGNALFHVDGGIDGLVHSRGKIARSGIYVSSGAVGLALGGILGSASAPMLLPVGLLVVCALLLGLMRLQPHTRAVSFGTQNSKAFSIALLLLFCAILIRSLGGFLIPMPWKAAFPLLGSICAALGKVAGGLLADRLGARVVGVVSLLTSIPLLCFGWQTAWLCAAGILLFNMNMPITLCAVSDRLRGHPGLAFGFTTLALLCGSLLPFWYKLPLQAALMVLPFICAGSAVCLLLSISTQKMTHNTQNSVPAAANK